MLWLTACAPQRAIVPFASLLRGDVDDSARLETTGLMYAPGTGNIYALADSDGGPERGECLALILRHEDRPSAVRLHGRSVRVRGRIIFLSDMTAMFPDQGGHINGRSWSGTICDGESTIFVSRLEPAAPPQR